MADIKPVTIYFQMHQPTWLHPSRDIYIWDKKNSEKLASIADENYLPTLATLTQLLEAQPKFRFALGVSGTLLDQAEQFKPELITALQTMFDAGGGERVELLDETYFDSLVGLFGDPSKAEFRSQVSMHRTKMRDTFGIDPTVFRHTGKRHNNDISDVVADMGFEAIVADVPNNGHIIDPYQAYRAKGSRLVVLPRAIELSHMISYDFSGSGITPEQYASAIGSTNGMIVTLGYAIERIGREDIRNFWRGFVEQVVNGDKLRFVTPGGFANQVADTDLPELDKPGYSSADWDSIKKAKRDTNGLINDPAQLELFKQIEALETKARASGGDLQRAWRQLTAYDNLNVLQDSENRPTGHENPYGSTAYAALVLTSTIRDLEAGMGRFEILTRSQKPTVMIVAPEPGNPPETMGYLARYVSGKVGGLGDVITALTEGFEKRGIKYELMIPNLKARFQRQSGMDREEYRKMRHTKDPGRIRLVDSTSFDSCENLYSGDHYQSLRKAAEFQKGVARILKIRGAELGGNMIVHFHDHPTGGVASAYANTAGIPSLLTVHNTHTQAIPLSYFDGFDLSGVWKNLYLTNEGTAVDTLATAVKNAWKAVAVSKGFADEIVAGYFPDTIIPASVRGEWRAKHEVGSAGYVLNSPSETMYPENTVFLRNPSSYYGSDVARHVTTFGPEDNVLEAKANNRVAIQKLTGLTVDPNAIILFWPSRLDPHQKGVHLMEEVAQRVVNEYNHNQGMFRDAHVQMVVVADGDFKHQENIGRIAVASGGEIAYLPFSDAASMLGYSAADVVFGSSLYEPCGQIDQVGNLHGALAVNRDTGGYHDKIEQLRLKDWGATHDHGNGFLFRDYDPEGLMYGLSSSIEAQVYFRRNPDTWDANTKRIMNEARDVWALDRMVANYITVLEAVSGQSLI